MRVSAIRSLGALKDAKAVDPLIGQFRKLLSNYSVVKRKIKQPSEKNEILELETALGRLLTNSNDKKVVILLETFRKIDNNSSPETEIAFAHISPEKFIRSKPEDTYWLFPVPGSGIWPTAKFGSYAQGIAELSNSRSW